LFFHTGHCAAGLDDNRLLIFGGKGPCNKIFGDTWIYHLEEDRWSEIDGINDIKQRIVPFPRFHSAIVTSKKKNSLYLFGGTNEKENFNDLWAFRIKLLLWEKVITAGFAPSSRYGHCFISSEKGKTLLLLGGCTIDPYTEYEATQLPSEISLTAMNNQYSSLLDLQFIQLNKKLKGLSSTDYKIAEETLYENWKNAKAMNYYTKKNSRHTNPLIDLYFFNLENDMWEERKFPKFSGEIPRSRMYFTSQVIGHFVFLIGGAFPTSLLTKPIDQYYTEINILDLRTHTWTKPIPITSLQYYKQTLLIAEADVIRAQKKLNSCKLEGLSLGVLNGLTKEVALAEALLNVCLWRKQNIENQAKEEFLSPDPTIAATMTIVRQRLVYVGGFTPGKGFRRDVLDLSVEHIYERERRLEELYHAKLELERKEEEAKLNMERLISAYELRAAIMEERRSRDRELQEMSLQDVREL
jgi:hypothetical protein